MSERRVVIAASRHELADLVADKFVVRAAKSIRRTGRFRVVLTGGTIGIEVLHAIALHPRAKELDWSAVSIWWGDERFVPAGHPDRNDVQATAVFLGRLGFVDGNIHRFPAADGLDAETAAGVYRELLRGQAEDNQEWPEFDLAFAGMGPDGHVLSVFPGSDQARSAVPDVLAVRNSPKPPPERLTMTIPLLNRATRVWMVVAGSDKAAGLALALADASTIEVPAAGVRGRQSTKIFIDQELAARLPEDLIASRQFWSAEDERADYVPIALR